MNIIPVNATSDYNVIVSNSVDEYIKNHLITYYNSKKIAFITDDKVKALYYSHFNDILANNSFDTYCFEIKSGESSKSLSTVSAIYDFLSEKKFTRNDLIIALGGGVVGDIAGFCAATFLRSIPYINIPTTLLAQVDSSIGGKTGINTSYGKNLIGAFYQPKLVCCDVSMLKTLPQREFNAGMSEVIKCSLISLTITSQQILQAQNDINALKDVITNCIKIKADIVKKDVYDKNERMILNLGHTIAHAVERFYDYKKFNHGEAVAIGLSMMTKACENAGMCLHETYKKVTDLLKAYSLPISCDAKFDELLPFICSDKKNDGDEINIVIIKEIGKAEILRLKQYDFYSFMRGAYEH